MADPGTRLNVSFAEYLEFEGQAELKHQLVDGEIFATTGGTFAHALMGGNLYFALRRDLVGTPCVAVGSDARVRIEAADLVTYPDLTVLCGPREAAHDDPDSTTNPTLLAEVLSPSTERFDRGRKRDAYFQLPSLRYYVLVRSDRRRLELYSRNDDGSWTWRAFDDTDTMPLAELGIDLLVAEVYDGVELDDDATSVPPEEPLA